MKPSRLLVILPFIAPLVLAQTDLVRPTPIMAIPTRPGGPEPVVTPITVTPAPVNTSLELTLAPHDTTIALDVGFGVQPVMPARATVPVGDKLRLTVPSMGGDTTYIWTKDGQAIAGAPSSNVLTIQPVLSGDAGVYACLFSTPTTLPKPSQQLILGVGPTDRLLNLSTRGIVGAGPDEGLTTGFVVAAGRGGKKIILRAVGPSLASFGVANPLRKPVLRIYDSNGRLYENGYVYPAVVGGPTFETDLSESLVRTGAFPIPQGTDDQVDMKPFLPGSYTATVTSGDGTTGSVLLEIYEVP